MIDDDLDAAFDQFVAELAMIFKHHFQIEPTVLGPSGEPTTPFIAFAIAVMKEDGIAVTPARVSDAGRRRGVPEDR